VIDPDEVDEIGHPMVRPKNDIRGLTHMHHALDAATIALAAHFFPLRAKGQDQKGTIWRILFKRNRDAKENDFLMGLGGIFERHRTREGKDEVRLKDLPKSLKNALARSLAQCRVAQHLPSDRSGAKAELTTWGVVSIDGEGEDARVKLRQNSSAVENGVRKRIPKAGEERAGKLLGINPKQGRGKLKAIKGVMVIGENYGLALDPIPTVIPFHDVSARLSA